MEIKIEKKVGDLNEDDRWCQEKAWNLQNRSRLFRKIRRSLSFKAKRKRLQA